MEMTGRPRLAYSPALLRTLLTAVLLTALIRLSSPAAAQDEPVTPTEPNNLRIVRTQHYEIHTDLNAALVTELAQRMDTMYGVYASRLSEFSPPKDAPPLKVYLFNRRAEYMEFTLYQAANTGGVFMTGPRTCLASFLQGQGRDALRRTLQHEAFHQFAYYTISKRMPIWLNEGLAQLFEEGIWTGRDFVVGEVPPRRVRQLNDDIRNHTLVDFKTFMAVTPQDWMQTLTGSAEKGATYYNQAWSMVEFMAAAGNEPYQRRLLHYLLLLHQGESDEAALRAIFPTGTADFQDDFARWATSLHPTPMATMLERQDTLGDFLVALWGKQIRFDSMMQFRTTLISQRYQLQYVRGNVTWKSDSPQVYFSDLSNRLFPPRELYFQHVTDAPLPDIVCRASDNLQLRTHFYRGAEKIEHEELINADAE